ncbi:MAG: phosphoribosyltransferase family protein [Candidatus Liptonbacteria bacterium]|nr:phosphoribosyltransferase family protein [Candidatus Liptonbacteria bacterium]
MDLLGSLNDTNRKSPLTVKKIWGKHLRSFFDSILDIFFPSLCIKCGKSINSREAVCLLCFEGIPLNKSFFCGKCGARLPAVASLARRSLGEGVAKVGLPYGKKICHFDFPYVLGAATTYKNETARGLVRELKFGFIRNAARPLAKLLISYVENMGFTDHFASQNRGLTRTYRGITQNITWDDWVVVPIPLGAKRMRQRGFNQAALIAEIFAERFSLVVEKGGFVRQNETRPQSEMENFGSRLKNTRDCFKVTASEKFSGKNIILIDDVSTSGATFLEATESLKKSGAKKIIALAAVKG